MKIEKVKHSYFTKMYLQFDPTPLKLGDAVESDIYIRKDNNYVIIIEAGSVITEKIYNLLNKQEKLYLLKEKEKIVEEEKQVPDCDVLQLHIKKNKNNLS